LKKFPVFFPFFVATDLRSGNLNSGTTIPLGFNLVSNSHQAFRKVSQAGKQDRGGEGAEARAREDHGGRKERGREEREGRERRRVLIGFREEIKKALTKAERRCSVICTGKSLTTSRKIRVHKYSVILS
jgi:hypothetical protein